MVVVLLALSSLSPPSLQDHTPLLRPQAPGPMTLGSKLCFLTLAFEVPVPCKVYVRLRSVNATE